MPTPSVPQDYQRKQTIANSERYITPELKEQEALVLAQMNALRNWSMNCL